MQTNQFQVNVSRHVEQQTRDGVVLRADIYRPDAEGSWPVLICRTPYDKSAARNVAFAEAIASRGYIAVVQDVRGTHASDGDFVWHFRKEAVNSEALDGHDCVEWAARLPGSDGRVGTFGVSYAAWLSWCLIVDPPPSLKAMSVSGMVASIRDMNFGVIETGRRLQWTYAMAAGLRQRAGDSRPPSTMAEADADWLDRLRSKWIWRLPLDSIPDQVFEPLADQLRSYYRDQASELWGFGRFHTNVGVPVCIQTGWWDRFSLSISHYEGLQRTSPPKLARQHRLLVGPWPHSPLNFNGRIGPVDYGTSADVTYADLVTDWYDACFKGGASQSAGNAPVQLFILNDNRWYGFDNWPPAGMRESSFFLSSGGKANTPDGDGTLTRQPPNEQPPDRFVYDPADPVMSLMGADAQLLPVDQRPNARRNDILVYQTEPLVRDLLLIGPVRLDLWAASDRPDTDFCAKLIEVRPDGLAINISTGILRARYRKGYERPVMLERGQPTLFRITMLPVGIRLQAGSRLRVDVTSSDFPAFDRNHNTGGDDWAETELAVARQTVFHDPQRPSRLIVPEVSE